MRQIRRCLGWGVALSVCVVALGGCAAGPSSIAVGRGLYNEVINRTEDEQLLNMIVRDRYGETYGMLAVASVTASVRARTDLRAEFGLSRSLQEDYEGNLVPLGATIAVEENPTISYVPLTGEQFVQRLLSPLSLDELLLIGGYLGEDREHFLAVGLASINGLRNPLTVESGQGSADFARVVQLWKTLRVSGALRVARDSQGQVVAVFRTSEADAANIEELLRLARIPTRPTDAHLLVPVRLAMDIASSESFAFVTRSVLEVVRSAGECIEIPTSHLNAGIVAPRPERSSGWLMHIRTSRVDPRPRASVAVSYRGWWYYVAADDVASKKAFSFLRALVGLRLYERGSDTAAPVLTIPVR